MARLKIPIDYEAVGKLARVGLTMKMVADFLEIDIRTAERDEKLCRTYKKNLVTLGVKVRTSLMSKMDTDTTANIYLDKVLNKTTEKNHDDNIQMKRDVLELEREKVEKGLTTEPINVIIQKVSEK
ncbi:MAG: hypothetical protein ACRC6E_09790 [Fusobacteriaceae bacterium]